MQLRDGRYYSVPFESARLDGVDKVTGKAKFTADIRVPGMLCASILRPPAHGAKRVA